MGRYCDYSDDTDYPSVDYGDDTDATECLACGEITACVCTLAEKTAAALAWAVGEVRK